MPDEENSLNEILTVGAVLIGLVIIDKILDFFKSPGKYITPLVYFVVGLVVIGGGGFYLYKKSALTKQIDGVIIADLTINVEESKYQYQINNFRFIQYARNRFGQFVPKSSRKYALEKYYPDNQGKTWRGHFEAINVKIEKMATDLEVNMYEMRKND